jgi:hypothetical protein
MRGMPWKRMRRMRLFTSSCAVECFVMMGKSQSLTYGTPYSDD